MTIRDMFVVLIKLFALYSIVTLFAELGSTTSVSFNKNCECLPFFAMAGILVLLLGFFVLVFRKAEGIVSLLKLEREFSTEGNITFTASSDKISLFIIIFISGFLIVNNFPDLIGNTLVLIMKEYKNLDINEFEIRSWFSDGIKTFLGVLIFKLRKNIQYIL